MRTSHSTSAVSRFATGRAPQQNSRASTAPSSEWSPPRPLAMSWNRPASSSSSGLRRRGHTSCAMREALVRLARGEATPGSSAPPACAGRRCRHGTGRTACARTPARTPESSARARPAAPCASAFRPPAGRAAARRKRVAQFRRGVARTPARAAAPSASARAVCECRPRMSSRRPTPRTTRKCRQRRAASRLARGEVATAQFERRPSIGSRLGLAFELFLEALQQAVADAQHQRSAAIEALHHLFDGEVVGVVDVTQPRGEQSSGNRNATAPRACRRPGAGRSADATARGVRVPAWRTRRRRAGRSPSATPRSRRYRRCAAPSSAASARRAGRRAFLQVRLEVVGGVAETRVARALLLALGGEVFARRPDDAAARSLQPAAQVASKSASSGRASSKRGEHGDVGCRGLRAFVDRTHGVAHRQAGIPQQREEARKRIGMRGLRIGFGRAPAGRCRTAETIRRGRSHRPRTATAAHPAAMQCDQASRTTASTFCARAREQTIDIAVVVEARGQRGVGFSADRVACRRGPLRVGDRISVGGRRGAHRSLSSPGNRVRISTPSRSRRRCAPTAPTACGPW